MTHKTPEIEEIKDNAIQIWVEQDIYQAFDYIITTLTTKHQEEIEKAVEI